jgi:hypothetical protein
MFTVSNRIAELTKLMEDLKAAPTHSSDTFRELINRMVELRVFDEEKVLRVRFGLSVSSFERWKNGRTAPHPAMRRPIYDNIALGIERLLTKLKSEVSNPDA